MKLPIRIFEQRTDERVISVDGAWDQPGLNLSHWPGHTTPRELRHDLSTGVALNFARLPEARRRELARDCTALANNHYDTDGVCALFAVRHPERALPRADRLLEAAATGDFFRVPSERAFQTSTVIGAFADRDASPLQARFNGLSDHDRLELALTELVERLDVILDGDLTELSELWRAPLEDLRADRADLSRAQRDELVHLDVALFTGPPGLASSRAHSRVPHFDPGRHALFGATNADRVLVVGSRGAGATYRFLIGTTSWFDIGPGRALPRPALEDLARRLNEIEATEPAHALAWRAQPTDSPSPELWFGRTGQPWFAEHAEILGESRLSPQVVKSAILDALRAAWTFPNE